jgi:hypothetical protein
VRSPTILTSGRLGLGLALAALVGIPLGSRFTRVIPAERRLPEGAAAALRLSGEVTADPVDGSHHLRITVRNDSDWGVTELRLRLGFAETDLPVHREITLRCRETLHPGRSEALVTRLHDLPANAREPRWTLLEAWGRLP